jgi:hypothetical protein
MPFKPLQRFNSIMGAAPRDDYGGLLSPQDQRAATQAFRAQLASGLLSAAGPQRMPVSLGQAIGGSLPQAMQARDYRAETGIRNDQYRREIERENRQLAEEAKQREAMERFRGLLGPLGGEENAEVINGLFDVAPGAVVQGLLGRVFQQQQPQTYESPVGKLLADRELAVRRNDTEGVAALDKAIKGEVPEGTDFGEILRVRNDMIRNSGEFTAAQTGYEKVQAAARSDSPAGDMALIFGFMKILDPGSIVKEGEFATVENSQGVPDQIRNIYNKVMTGERLTPEQRQDFMYQAREQYVPLIERQQRFVRDAEGFAQRNKLPLADIVPGYLIPTLPAPLPALPKRPEPAAGTGFLDRLKNDASNLLDGFGGQQPQVPPPPPGYTLDKP